MIDRRWPELNCMSIGNSIELFVELLVDGIDANSSLTPKSNVWLSYVKLVQSAMNILKSESLSDTVVSVR